MYAVKPWGSVLLVGSTTGSYAMGIGMRWRESNVSIIEKRESPAYERTLRVRCVLTNQSVKQLVDLGGTEQKIRSILRPAVGWRFLGPDLRVLREGSTFPGCAVGETAYHCTKGALLRILRSEFLRFGGAVQWATTAMDAYECQDGSGTWSLRKSFGLGSGAEAIITSAKGTSLSSMLIAEDPERMAVLFDVRCGICRVSDAERMELFGNQADVCFVVGGGRAVHLWLLDTHTCSWRVVQKAMGSARHANDAWMEGLPAVVRGLLASAEEGHMRVCALPARTPAVREAAATARVSVLGDGLLPVDPFEWRGDNARCSIEEASALCRAFYGKKYHRGDVPFLLRGMEQEFIAKRANLLSRDLQDAEHFLAVYPTLGHDTGGAHALGVEPL